MENTRTYAKMVKFLMDSFNKNPNVLVKNSLGLLFYKCDLEIMGSVPCNFSDIHKIPSGIDIQGSLLVRLPDCKFNKEDLDSMKIPNGRCDSLVFYVMHDIQSESYVQEMTRFLLDKCKSSGFEVGSLQII